MTAWNADHFWRSKQLEVLVRIELTPTVYKTDARAFELQNRGGIVRNRTEISTLKRRLLYQLSYEPVVISRRIELLFPDRESGVVNHWTTRPFGWEARTRTLSTRVRVSSVANYATSQNGRGSRTRTDTMNSFKGCWPTDWPIPQCV